MIHIGQPAPEFKNITSYEKGAFSQVALSDFRGKWLVFFFYPRDFTFVCPTELRTFAKMKSEFDNINCNLLAASTDSEWSHKTWFENNLPEVNYPILADTTHSVAKSYDVYNESDGLAERGLFIIDPEGIIRYVVVSSGSVGRSVRETLRVLEALQSGELCPVEWEPGQKTLGKA